MKHVAVALWLLFIAAPLLAVSWVIWQLRDLFGQCELKPGYNPYCWHYHSAGPVRWLTVHIASYSALR